MEARQPLAHVVNATVATSRFTTLIDALRPVEGEPPDEPSRPGLGFLDARCELTAARTRGDVWREACQVGHGLLSRGLSAGERVLVMLPTGPEFLASFFGVQLAGGVPVPCPAPFRVASIPPHMASLSAILRGSGARLLIADAAVTEPVRIALGDGIREVVSAEDLTAAALAGVGSETDFPTLDPDAPALVQYTSGPLLEPTGVVLSHRAVLANVAGIGDALGLESARSTVVSWLPLYQDMGLIGTLMTSLVFRMPCYLLKPESFLFKPAVWLQAISKYGASLSAAPNFAYRLCARRVRPERIDGLDLTSWRVAFNGAETIDATTREVFGARFGDFGFSADAFVPVYGLAENSLVATTRPAGAAQQTYAFDGRELVSVGRPIAGMEVAVVDDANAVVREGQVGEVRLRGPSVMAGYLGDPERSRAHLRDGWLATGDLGLVDDGELYLVGRRKQLIIKRGKNYYPADLEAAVRDLDGAGGDTVVVASAEANERQGTEDVIVTIESPDHDDQEACRELSAAISRGLMARFGLGADRVDVVAPRTLGSRREPLTA